MTPPVDAATTPPAQDAPPRAAPPRPLPAGRPEAVKKEPAGDVRLRILDGTMKKHQFQPDALIEVLHKAQELFGFLEEDLLFRIARGLKVPPSRVWGVATFYHFFSMKPQGEHLCTVCMGTACYVKGANRLLEAMEAAAGIRAGETTPDGKVTILTARCVGACGIAPVVVNDNLTAGHQTEEAVVAQVKGWLANGTDRTA